MYLVGYRNMIYMYLYILLVHNNSGNAAAGIARGELAACPFSNFFHLMWAMRHEPFALTCGAWSVRCCNCGCCCCSLAGSRLQYNI